MKFYKPLLLLLLCPIGLLAQTSVTATLTDSDSQTWNNGTWTATLFSPNGTPQGCTTKTTASGTMSGSGVLTGSLCDTTLVSPSGAQWRFTLCPNASAGCSVVTTAVSGASESLSTVLSAGLTAPRFAASSTAFGYLDVEVITTPTPGGVYFNVTTPIQRIWTGSAWTNNGGSGGSGTVTSVSVTAANGVSGTVATATTTPAISLTLGAIVPTSVNGITLTTGGSATTFLNGAGAYTTPSGGGACGSGNIPCTNTVNTFTAEQTIADTSASSASTLALSNSSTSNVAGLSIQSAGGHLWEINGGGTDFGNTSLYFFDSTASATEFALNGPNAVLSSAGVLAWTGSNPTATATAGISQCGAGIFCMGVGVANNTGALVKAVAMVSASTKFTTSGCSVSSTTGGATAGVFTVGANTCTVVVTMNGATGATAPNGWSCYANDRTSTTVFAIQQTASSATTASFSIPATAGATDVINFGCTGY